MRFDTNAKSYNRKHRASPVKSARKVFVNKTLIVGPESFNIWTGVRFSVKIELIEVLNLGDEFSITSLQ